MALLTAVQCDLGGVDLQAVDAAAAGGGDTFNNDGNTYFYADNADASGTDITFDDTGSKDPGYADSFDPDVTVTVAAGDTMLIGPFPIARFGDSVAVSYTSVTSLTVAAIRCG
jgi:hypothetical protein